MPYNCCMLRLPLGLALFALYCWTAAPAVGFEDSVGFSLSCLNADIAHAPGFPLYALLCHPFARWLPLNPAAAAAVFSAACAALACVVFASAAFRLCGDKTAAAAAALLYGVSAGFWAQATIPEVYSLNALLFLLALEFALRARKKPKPRRLLALIFICALGLSNHWPLFVLAGASLPFVLHPARGAVFSHLMRPKIAFAAAALVFAGLSPYFYMVWRTNHPETFMGLPFAIGNFSDFWQIVSRAVHYASDEKGGGFADKIAFLSFAGQNALWLQFTALGGVMAAAGFVLQWRKLPGTLAAALTVLFLTGTAVLILLLGFVDTGEQRQIFAAYPLLPYAAACFWAALAAAHWRRGGIAALFFTAVLSFAAHFSENNRRGGNIMETVIRAYFKALPNDASWVPPPSLFKYARYFQITKNLRPDVWVLPPPNPLNEETDFGGRHLYPPNKFTYETEIHMLAGHAQKNGLCYNTYLPLAGEWRAAEYFIFTCLDEKAGEKNSVIYKPEIAEFIRRLLSAKPPKNIQGRNTLGKITEDAARTMLRLEARRELPEEWRELLQAAKQTPDGLLAELEFLSALPDLIISEKRAKQYAAKAKEAEIVLTRPRRAQMLAALGDIFAAVSPRGDSSLAAAKKYYARVELLISGKKDLILPRIFNFYRRESLIAEEQALIAKYGGGF